MKRWLVNMSAKFDRFMRYRYGQDQLNNFLAFIYFILVLINWLLVKDMTVQLVIDVILLFLILAIFMRYFSKKKIQRSRENHHYLNFKYKIKGVYNRIARKTRNRTNYKYFKCPNCSQELRIPRGRGKLSVTCPKCRTVFDKKS